MLTPSVPASSRTLGHYRLETVLGEGGMGVVYEAYDTQLERYVAVKLVREPLLAEPEARDQLIAEARSASALNHPNICTVHDIGQSNGETYIVMERVEGQPLSSLITGGLSPEQVVSYGGQIADALAHAHAHGIVHRDLKSANVMITPEGRVKVLDFGLATRIRERQLREAGTSRKSVDEIGAIAGTLHYVSPEVLYGKPADQRSDTWAFGVLLYEMATGQLPFSGATTFELLLGDHARATSALCSNHSWAALVGNRALPRKSASEALREYNRCPRGTAGYRAPHRLAAHLVGRFGHFNTISPRSFVLSLDGRVVFFASFTFLQKKSGFVSLRSVANNQLLQRGCCARVP
jgi:serine/threonine protein kinase